jgi:hypothetical protein
MPELEYDDTIVPEHPNPQPGLIEYQCERCGYKYNKLFDYAPFLCYRCMRFIAKRMFTIMNTIQPPISRPERDEV